MEKEIFISVRCYVKSYGVLAKFSKCRVGHGVCNAFYDAVFETNFQIDFAPAGKCFQFHCRILADSISQAKVEPAE